MNRRGGYTIDMAGFPAATVAALPVPRHLHMPLGSRRLAFTDLRVSEAQRVAAGSVLATDPTRHGLPLLAPRGGTVQLDDVDGHITLTDLAPAPAGGDDFDLTAIGGSPRHRLVTGGAWQYFHDAHTLAVPDPDMDPAAIIISTLRLEPFGLRGDVQLHQAIDRFCRSPCWVEPWG